MTNFNPSSLNNVLLISLSRAAEHFVAKMKEKRSAQRLPEVIDSATSIDPPQAYSGGASIEIKIDLNKAPMAAAFEWGSGLHDQRKPTLYPIPIRKPGPLHFYWKERSKWFKGAKLPFGHPGVAPRPFIEPTIEATLPEIKRIIGKEVKASIVHHGVTIIKA